MTQLEHRSVVHLRSRSWLILSACLAGSLLAVFASRVGWYTTDTSTGSPSVESSRVQASLAKIPLSFIDNAGQSDPQVRFQVKGAGHTLFFTPEEVVFSASRKADDEGPAVSSVVRLQFEGANPAPTVEGIERLPGVANFFIGNDPSRWRSGVATYGGVAYRELYPGVELLYRGSEGQLKSEFVASPGVNPKVITLEYSGMENMWIRGDGALVLKTELGELVEEAPVVYQETGGERMYVEARYVLLEPGKVGFEVGAYDRSTPLVIDPSLVYSTYLGGNDVDGGSDIAVDGSGNVYVTGSTDSTDFPTQNPLQGTYRVDDAFVSKLNASGTALVYSTYLGGSDDEEGFDIAVDGSGNAYIVGWTASEDFPTQDPIQGTRRGTSDAFVSKLNAAGTALVYSTYLGGSDDEENLSGGIAVDGSGNAYVTGWTYSTDFPMQNPIQGANAGGRDVFVSKLNTSGTDLVYSTYLGGSESDAGSGIAVDDSGNAYVTGRTPSEDFPTQSPFQGNHAGGFDVFISKLNASGTALVYSTYLGGSGFDSGLGIAVDDSGNAYVTGETNSTDFPMQNPLQGTNRDYAAFVSKLNASGTALVYSTYLGGSGFDVGSGIAVDDSDNAYVTGRTDSFDFPTQPPIQDTFGGDGNAFVSKLNASGTALVYSTYLGGSVGDGGSGIAVDDSGNAYVTGDTESWDFPTKNPIQRSNAGNEDAFVAKITELELVNDLVTFEPDPNTFSTNDDTTGCPLDYVGKFNFGATLTNISQSMLSDLYIKVAEISNGNLLLTRPLTRSRDQGRIFSTDGNLQLGTEEWSQSITTGISGQLAEIQIQFHYGIPTPTPTLRLSIFDGGNPISGSALFSEQLTLTSANVFTWDVSSANLFFDVGDVFSFVLQADASGYEIAGNDPPGYDGGDLFRNRLAFPELSDIAFITYMKPKSGVTIGAGDVFPVPKENGYSDGLLSPAEYVDVPLTICLKNTNPFRFFVDVLGVAEGIDL